MVTNIVFTQVVERPARKLLIYPGIKATGYWDYIAEVDAGYAWETISNIPYAINYQMSVWLPEGMRRPGTSEYCLALEIENEYEGPIPEGFYTINLPPCKYMVFQGEPYEARKNTAKP